MAWHRGYCTETFIFRQMACPDFHLPRCRRSMMHRIASLKRLVDEKLFCGVLPDIIDTVH